MGGRDGGCVEGRGVRGGRRAWGARVRKVEGSTGRGYNAKDGRGSQTGESSGGREGRRLARDEKRETRGDWGRWQSPEGAQRGHRGRKESLRKGEKTEGQGWGGGVWKRKGVKQEVSKTGNGGWEEGPPAAPPRAQPERQGQVGSVGSSPRWVEGGSLRHVYLGVRGGKADTLRGPWEDQQGRAGLKRRGDSF